MSMGFEMTELDPKKIKGRLPGWLVGKTRSGKHMVVHISQIVAASGEWSKGPSYIMLPGGNWITLPLPLADVVEKIRSFGELDLPSPIYRVVEAIARIIAAGKAILQFLFRFTFRKANEKACEERFSLKLDKPKNNALLSTAPTRRG